MNSFSINFAYDSQNQAPDTRPGCWGQAGFWDFPIIFQDVPAGQEVRLVRMDGDCYGFIHGAAPDGTHAGVLCGLITRAAPDGKGGWVAANQPTPYLDPIDQGSGDCPLFCCHSVGPDSSTFRIPINADLANAVLDANNVALARMAVFLNDTGLPIHLEWTGVIQFEYINEVSA